MVLFIGVCCRLYSIGVNMRMRRSHANELARYYQRLENIEKRRLENERHTKNSFMVWAINRLGFLRRLYNR
tara:strand:+ start:1062 stop:1274 length:213 start_codon:yes stop_codon:yes gene_type:complete